MASLLVKGQEVTDGRLTADAFNDFVGNIRRYFDRTIDQSTTPVFMKKLY